MLLDLFYGHSYVQRKVALLGVTPETKVKLIRLCFVLLDSSAGTHIPGHWPFDTTQVGPTMMDVVGKTVRETLCG